MHRTITTHRFAQSPRPEFMLSAKVAESVRHACKLGFEGIVSKRLGSPYVSGRTKHWVKSKNPATPAVKREAEENWDRERWR
jgi:ATP-dependent DNA ligase